MIRKRISTRWLLAAGALLLASSSLAQEPGQPQDRIEIRLMGGGLAAGSVVLAQPAFSAGVEGAIRLTPVVAVTGRYVYDRLGSESSAWCDSSRCWQDQESGNMHEFGGGFRFSAPNRSRFEPYGAIGVGGGRWFRGSSYSSAAYTTAGYAFPASSGSFSGGVTKLAVTVGAGVNCRVTRRTGINLDVSGVGVINGVNEMPDYLTRTSVGFYFRF